MEEKEDRNAVIRGLRASGVKLQELANEYGVSKARVAQITHGVKVQKKVKYTTTKKPLYPIGHKKCPDCKTVKEFADFHKDAGNKHGISVRCKVCAIARGTQHNRTKLGVSREEYLAILDVQDGLCAICGVDKDPNGKEFALDHDHKTGKVRGLLCSSCNRLLGHAKDSTKVLDKAKEYLLKHQNQ